MAIEVQVFDQLPKLKSNKFLQTVQLPFLLPRKTTTYDESSFWSTKVVARGDSFCEGFIRYDQGKKVNLPPSACLVDCINTAFGVQWQSDVLAQEGATTQQVRQLILCDTSVFFNSSVGGIDVYLSMLGNDPVMAILEEFNPSEMERLSHGKLSLTLLRRLSGCIKSGFLKHENGIKQVVKDLTTLYYDGAKINRLFFQGIPNIGKVPELELVLAGGNVGPTASLDLAGRPLLSGLLSTASGWMDFNNRRILSEISMPFDCLYSNIRHSLSRSHFEATHPNESGYRRIALQIMNLQYAEFQGQSSSFRQEYERRIGSQRLAA